MFLGGNFTYQYMQTDPDYWVATERCISQAWAMLFIVHYPKVIPKLNKNTGSRKNGK